MQLPRPFSSLLCVFWQTRHRLFCAFGAPSRYLHFDSVQDVVEPEGEPSLCRMRVVWAFCVLHDPSKDWILSAFEKRAGMVCAILYPFLAAQTRTPVRILFGDLSGSISSGEDEESVRDDEHFVDIQSEAIDSGERHLQPTNGIGAERHPER